MTATAREAPTRAGNVASRILAWTQATPDTTALVIPRAWDGATVTDEEVVTYGDLGRGVAAFADGLAKHGIGAGDRVVVLFPVGADLFALALAVLALGATLTFVDTSMRPGRIRQALALAGPSAIVTVARILRVGAFVPEVRAIPVKVCVDGAPRGALSLDDLRGDPSQVLPIAGVRPDDEALVTFTSGSTGSPKGADRTHGVLSGQLEAVMAAFPGGDDDVDLSVQPVGALADLAVGATCLMAPMDYRDPSSLDPAVTLDHMRRWGVTRLGAAPYFLDRLERHAAARRVVVPTLRHIFTGGAPVSPELCARLQRTFPAVEGLVAYGATEAEPISTCSFADIIGFDGDGYAVGRPVAGIALHVVRLPDAVTEVGAGGMAAHEVDAGAVGEVVVAGPHVVTRYVNADSAARATKLRDAEGTTWHRTGDLARRCPDGGLELVGRTADVVDRGTTAVHPYPIEREVAADPSVTWAALVAHEGAPHGELLVVPSAGVDDAAAVAVGAAVLARRGLGAVAVVAVDHVALDVRHLSKLDRPELRRRRVAAALARAFAIDGLPGAERAAALVPPQHAARLLAWAERRRGRRAANAKPGALR